MYDKIHYNLKKKKRKKILSGKYTIYGIINCFYQGLELKSKLG